MNAMEAALIDQLRIREVVQTGRCGATPAIGERFRSVWHPGRE
jgi:hypothetical protein